MAKRGPMNDVEAHYIMTSGLSTEEIAKQLNRTVKAVEKYQQENVVDQPAVEPSHSSPTMFQKLVDQARNGVEGVTVMDKTLSDLGDQNSAKTGNWREGRRYQNCIAPVKQ